MTPSNHINKIWPKRRRVIASRNRQSPRNRGPLWLEMTSAVSNYISSLTYLESFFRRDFSSSLASFMLFMS